MSQLSFSLHSVAFRAWHLVVLTFFFPLFQKINRLWVIIITLLTIFVLQSGNIVSGRQLLKHFKCSFSFIGLYFGKPINKQILLNTNVSLVIWCLESISFEQICSQRVEKSLVGVWAVGLSVFLFFLLTLNSAQCMHEKGQQWFMKNLSSFTSSLCHCAIVHMEVTQKPSK